jgi:hypothetical protein
MGGVPIIADGKAIGAVGVSGATAQQDGQVAKVGADTAAAKYVPSAEAAKEARFGHHLDFASHAPGGAVRAALVTHWVTLVRDESICWAQRLYVASPFDCVLFVGQ